MDTDDGWHPDRLTTPLGSAPGPLPARALALRRRRLDLTARTAVMAIVNVTPDSFYDRGATAEVGAALERARSVVAAGADMVDIGGVKGGPGRDVPVEEERERVVPLITAIRADADARLAGTVVSVDTYRAEVADAALAAGADLVNDVGSGHDPEVPAVAAEHDAGYIAMHHGGAPRTRPFRPSYEPDVVTAVVRRCAGLAETAIAAGVAPDRVVVDPGHDFVKTTYHSLEVSRRLPELAALGFPVLVALSNKDFVGETLDAALEQRVDGSLAAAVFCVLRGASIVRAHEVGRTVDALRMTEALLGWRPPATARRGLE